MSTRPVDLLLSKLNAVTKTGQDRWRACCPAHPDRHPSLSIAIGKSGSPVIKCWSGCSAVDVLNALELDFSDLYPSRSAKHGERGARRYFFPTDVFEDIKSAVQLAFFYAKSANTEGLLDVCGKLQAIGFAYDFDVTKGEDHAK